MTTGSNDINWDILEKASVAIATIGAILTFVLTPFADKLFVWMFKRSKNEIQTQLADWNADHNRQHDEMVSSHATLNLQFREHIQHQSERDNEMMGRFEKVFAEQNATLRAIHEEAQATANSVSHIYGLLEKEPWDGRTERRQNERRG